MTTQATTITPITFIFRVPEKAYCPGCAAAITQKTYMIRHDALWCLRCGCFTLDHVDWIRAACDWSALNHQWTIVRGLRIWTPDNPLDGIVTHYLKSREESHATIQHDDYYSNLTPPEDLIA